MFDIPRHLIYQDCLSLDDFGVHDNKGVSYNYYLYKELLRKKSPTNSNDRMKEILSIFNTAYYLVTIFLIDPCPETRVGSYCDVARYRNNYSPLIGNQIIALFYFYIESMESYGKLAYTIDEFTDLLFEMIDLDVKNEIKSFEECSEKKRGMLVLPEDFPLRKVGDELFSSIKWKDVTLNFNYRRIDIIVKYVGTNELEKHSLLESIYQQMKKDKDLSEELIKDKEQFIALMKYNVVLGQLEDDDENEKLLSYLIEKENAINYQTNLEEKYAKLLKTNERIEKEFLELKSKSESLSSKEALGAEEVKEEVENEEDSKIAPSKVRAQVLLEILNLCDMGTKIQDLTKISRLIGFIIGQSPEKLRQTLSKDGRNIVLKRKTHQKYVDEVNKILSDMDSIIKLECE